MRRTGPARIEPVLASTPINATLGGTWVGRYDIGLGSREVSLRLGTAADGRTAKASMTLVGRRTFDIDFDIVAQRGAFVTLTATDAGISIEGPCLPQGAWWSLTWHQGPFESALALRRPSAP